MSPVRASVASGTIGHYQRIMPKSRRPTVVILAYDGLCTFEYGCAVEVFALPRPEFGAHWYRCAIAAVEPGRCAAAAGS